MKKMIAFRLDDICETMHFDNFKTVIEILIKKNACPLLGVVPDNKDPKLIYQEKITGFDNMISSYLLEGCSLAMHGFHHLYDTEDKGMLKVGKKSEFAGHTELDQRSRINSGLNIMKQRGYNPCIFMAPSHTYDITTVQLLNEVGFRYITDGYTSANYSLSGITFIPCKNTLSLKKPIFGVVTVCLHTNTMDDNEIIHLKRFIEKNEKYLVPFEKLMEQPCHNRHVKFSELISRAAFNMEKLINR